MFWVERVLSRYWAGYMRGNNCWALVLLLDGEDGFRSDDGSSARLEVFNLILKAQARAIGQDAILHRLGVDSMPGFGCSDCGRSA